MTRINLIDPAELMDQHLFAEFREIKMIPKSLARSLEAGRKRGNALAWVLGKVPKYFTLNTGHVSFFYNKGLYLHNRYKLIKVELRKRGIKFDENSELDPDAILMYHPLLWNDWEPTKEAIQIIRNRIAEKIEIKISWYRMFGTPLSQNPFAQWLNCS